MPDTTQPTFANANDQKFVSSIADAHLHAVVTDSLARYRRADRLNQGDAVPPLSLTHLADGRAVSLSALVGARPLVLIFGSYT